MTVLLATPLPRKITVKPRQLAEGLIGETGGYSFQLRSCNSGSSTQTLLRNLIRKNNPSTRLLLLISVPQSFAPISGSTWGSDTRKNSAEEYCYPHVSYVLPSTHSGFLQECCQHEGVQVFPFEHSQVSASQGQGPWRPVLRVSNSYSILANSRDGERTAPDRVTPVCSFPCVVARGQAVRQR